MSEETHAAPRLRAAVMVKGLAGDIGLPVAAYYALHLLGVADWPALLAATVAAALRIVFSALRDRRLNLFATVMLVVFGVSVCLALVSGDERFMLLKNSFVTIAVGATFLITAVWGRPLTLAAMQSFEPAKAAAAAEEYCRDPKVRRGYRVSSTVWGAGLVAEALFRVPLIYLLPVSVMVGLSEVLAIATFAALIAWNVWYTRRAEAG